MLIQTVNITAGGVSIALDKGMEGVQGSLGPSSLPSAFLLVCCALSHRNVDAHYQDIYGDKQGELCLSP